MLSQHYKELWEARFKKVLENERQSIVFFRRLLQENGALFYGTRAQKLLKQILREEAKHARIARKLVRLVAEKK